MNNQVRLFEGKKDQYSTITISSREEARHDFEFNQSLEASIQEWKKNEIKAIWFQIYLEDSSWVPFLASQGFVFHHAKPDYVTMVKWLSEEEENNIPSYAHNTIGVGAIVVSQDDEILLVKEKVDFQRDPPWKLPGGYIDPGEEIAEAAIREVKEETGIEAEFKFVVNFRHIHKQTFGCSNIYFVTYLEPKKKQINMCTREILDCRWMKIEEYLKDPKTTDTLKFFVRSFLEMRERGFMINSVQSKSRIPNRIQTIYYVDSPDGKSNKP